MARGRVKWFNDAKGYGFIERMTSDSQRDQTWSGFFSPRRGPSPSNAQEEIFVHFSAILSEGHKTLEPGQEVEFDIYDGPKGRVAQNVVRSNR